MENEDPREGAIQKVADMLRHNPFSVEFKVKKNPKGIRIIYEVSKEQMDAMVQYGIEKNLKKSKTTEES